jgi:radical SAM/Cys-rich protein
MDFIENQKTEYSDDLLQLDFLQSPALSIPFFDEKLESLGVPVLRPSVIDTLQINLGKMCNQTCSHCHVDAGPNRKEIMTRETLDYCLRALNSSPQIKTVDLTGGAPEMNPNFRWFVKEVHKLGRRIIVRSNLSILTVNTTYRELPRFFSEHRVKIISSLPCYTAENTDQQRGKGVFSKSIEALQSLNSIGYGKEGTGLELDLVYNPGGAFLPPNQEKLESDYKRHLWENHGISFNHLLCITNMPINRFLEYLVQAGEYEDYLQTLYDAFNPCSVQGVMCRNLISVGWDGKLFDCDFNQMLDLPVESGVPNQVKEFDLHKLQKRKIEVGRHCYGCTAGAGSSCGGVIL